MNTKMLQSLERIMKSGFQIRFQTVVVPDVLLVLRQYAPCCKRWQSSHGPWGSKANSWSVGACLYCNDLNLPINKLFSSEAHINIVLIACQLLGSKLDRSGSSLPRGRCSGILESRFLWFWEREKAWRVCRLLASGSDRIRVQMFPNKPSHSYASLFIFALPLNPCGPFAQTKPRNESETALLASSCIQSSLISRNRPRLEKMFVPWWRSAFK